MSDVKICPDRGRELRSWRCECGFRETQIGLKITAGDVRSIVSFEKLDLCELQEAVGGAIEFVKPRKLSDDLVLVVDEEGLVKGLPINPVASRLCGVPIAGDVVFLAESGDADGSLVGLSGGQLDLVCHVAFGSGKGGDDK